MRAKMLALRIGAIVGGLVAAILVGFLLAAWIGSSIPRGERLQDIDRPVAILIETNGIHTQLVLPIENEIKDWRETFPSANEWVMGNRPTHVTIGFGERDVFMNTPRWQDLTFARALRVAGVGGEGMIRVTNLVTPQQGPDRRSMNISREQYRKLVESILRDLPALGDTGFRTFERADYGPQDAYYASARRYTMSTTCNQWTSDRLADAGIRTGWWTPLSGGVMKWAPPYSTELPGN